MYCSYCGNQIADSAVFCGYCAVQVQSAPTAAQSAPAVALAGPARAGAPWLLVAALALLALGLLGFMLSGFTAEPEVVEVTREVTRLVAEPVEVTRLVPETVREVTRIVYETVEVETGW